MWSLTHDWVDALKPNMSVLKACHHYSDLGLSWVIAVHLQYTVNI